MYNTIDYELMDNHYATYKTYLKRCQKLWSVLNADELPDKVARMVQDEYDEADFLRDKYKKLFLADLEMMDDEEGWEL